MKQNNMFSAAFELNKARATEQFSAEIQSGCTQSDLLGYEHFVEH